MFELPNLDTLSTDSNDYRIAARIFRILGEYCENRSYSMEARRAGRIDEAVRNEEFNKRRYLSLPKWARWTEIENGKNS